MNGQTLLKLVAQVAIARQRMSEMGHKPSRKQDARYLNLLWRANRQNISTTDIERQKGKRENL